MGLYTSEFPLLPDLGLYAAEIRGDGNCLFNALSDQIFGNQNEHHTIRSRVIAFMRDHADYYKQFLDVKPGGGTRRNPKRKNAGAYSAPLVYTPPTSEEIDRAFESHIQRMAQGGTWGDNMEIVAFAAAYNTDVRIYLADYSYMIPGQGDEADRGMAHIAYHDWEHYSSIRNLEGPHTGLPEVQWKKLPPEEESRQEEQAAHKSYVEPWKIDVVRKLLPFLTDTHTIKKALEECKGNVNNAASLLIDTDEAGSISSAQESSSVEREPDSDEDLIYGPNKRANRSRIHRAARNLMREREQQRRDMAAKLAMNDGSQESVGQGIADLVIPDSQENSPRPMDGEGQVDDEWVPHQSDRENSTSLAIPTNKGPTRLKINPPKSPDGRVGKTHVRQQGPRSRGPTARERKEQKKQLQKAARKQRMQQAAQGELSGNQPDGLPILTKPKASTPVLVEGGMKTLYI